MSLGSYRRYLKNRRYAGRYVRQRTVEKVIGYFFFFLPRLMFWHTVRFSAIALGYITGLIAEGVSRLLVNRQEKDTAAAFNPPVDTVAKQLRADKRRQRDSALEDWDHELASLLGSGSMPQPAENVGLSPEQHPSVETELADKHALDGLDYELRRMRHALLARFHADIVKLHDARVAEAREDSQPASETEDQRYPISANEDDKAVTKHVPAGTDYATTAERGDLLAGDPRTMWAWAEYLNGRHPLNVSDEYARQILAAIPPGDHVEIFGAVAMGYPRQRKDALPREARFAARTFDSWILPSSGQQAETIPASNTMQYATATSRTFYMPESHIALADGRRMDAYADEGAYGRFKDGAGQSILRLPDNPLAPAPPELGTGGLNLNGHKRRGSDDALVADYIKAVTARVDKAQANYGSTEAYFALREAFGEDMDRSTKDRLTRAENYLKGAVSAVKRHPRIGDATHKAIVSHFRNADLRAAFFCQALGLPYPGDEPLIRPRKKSPTADDFY